MTNRNSNSRLGSYGTAPRASSGDWRSRAACLDEDPELFFPLGSAGPSLLQIEDAKAMCARCPVHMECLRWAMTIGVSDGVWGGHTADEINAAKRREKRKSQARCRADAGTTFWSGFDRRAAR